MAELVDALVSKTSGATRAGSTPALSTKTPQTTNVRGVFLIFSTYLFSLGLQKFYMIRYKEYPSFEALIYKIQSSLYLWYETLPVIKN